MRSACRTALLEAGFTPDDYFMDMESPMGMYAGNFNESSNSIKINIYYIWKMSYCLCKVTVVF